MKIKILIYLIISIILQIIFLPTLCGCGQNEAKLLIALTVDILIPLRLFYKPTKFDTNLYLAILLTSFIWIQLFIEALRYFFYGERFCLRDSYKKF